MNNKRSWTIGFLFVVICAALFGQTGCGGGGAASSTGSGGNTNGGNTNGGNTNGGGNTIDFAAAQGSYTDTGFSLNLKLDSNKTLTGAIAQFFPPFVGTTTVNDDGTFVLDLVRNPNTITFTGQVENAGGGWRARGNFTGAATTAIQAGRFVQGTTNGFRGTINLVLGGSGSGVMNIDQAGNITGTLTYSGTTASLSGTITNTGIVSAGTPTSGAVSVTLEGAATVTTELFTETGLSGTWTASDGGTGNLVGTGTRF
ncbi:MAG: hypothetical protein JST40_04050 [Armatimonadetes bacterium]|nr:hypothetical protein [Armatimonadota bacterium]